VRIRRHQLAKARVALGVNADVVASHAERRITLFG
jgi:hypothetical protein